MNVSFARSRRKTSILTILFVTALPTLSSAEAQLPGDGPSALPSVYRVGVIDSEQHRLTFSGAVGYGYTEGIISEEDRHHRLPLLLSLSYRPLSWLALAYTQDIRYDRHTGFPDDGDEGWILEPHFRVRGGWISDFGLRLGGEVGVWIPASDSLSSTGAGTSVDMTVLASFQPGNRPLLIATHAGFRLDRSGEGSTNADALSASDRLALGVSDSHSVLLGAALTWIVGPVELLGEWTWDLNVGDGSPEVGSSPMRLTVGGRLWVLEGLQISLLADVSLSSRPPVAQGESLVVVEPRVTVMAGLTYRLGLSGMDSGPRMLSGQVLTSGGAPLAGAQVTVQGRRTRNELVTNAEGMFETELPRRESPTVSVSAPGFVEYRETHAAENVAETPLRIVLEPLPAQIRGRVITTDNTPIGEATVRLVMGERELEIASSATGSFSFGDLQAGSFELTVQANGYQTGTVNGELSPGETEEMSIQLDPGLPEGQLQGTIRSLEGTPLRGHILVVGQREPIRAGEDGTFDISLPPGRYRIRIGLRGYREERRTVDIEENGVVVLNVDLRRSNRRRRR